MKIIVNGVSIYLNNNVKEVIINDNEVIVNENSSVSTDSTDSTNENSYVSKEYVCEGCGSYPCRCYLLRL